MEDGRKTGRERQRGRAGSTGDALAGAPGSRPGGESSLDPSVQVFHPASCCLYL